MFSGPIRRDRKEVDGEEITVNRVYSSLCLYIMCCDIQKAFKSSQLFHRDLSPLPAIATAGHTTIPHPDQWHTSTP